MTETETDEAARLQRAASRLGVGLDEAMAPRLLALRDLLVRWNRVYNLTAVRDPADMFSRHLLDSLSVAPLLRGARVIDVGTGAGFPGLPLAMVCPDRQFVLLDSALKRTRFVTHAVGNFGLDNVTVVTSRVEDYRPEAPFDTVMCRAFAPLERLVEQAAHLCAPGGFILAMKGAEPVDELAALPAGWQVRRIVPLEIPDLDARRCVVELSADSTG